MLSMQIQTLTHNVVHAYTDFNTQCCPCIYRLLHTMLSMHIQTLTHNVVHAYTDFYTQCCPCIYRLLHTMLSMHIQILTHNIVHAYTDLFKHSCHLVLDYVLYCKWFRYFTNLYSTCKHTNIHHVCTWINNSYIHLKVYVERKLITIKHLIIHPFLSCN